ncbi:MAG: cob(I)yrinic acid a,c-diamide adenosyltransferase [Prevotellaceae bacterium]|nr:cob(I)yrinic acid a,c-diamide adenosyltransferase [Prevotellaceae bacterium]
MKIYTKKGDGGETSLVGGARVPKNHPRVEAYGTVDELISHLGVVRAYCADEYYKKFIFEVQDRLMTCSALLASDGDTAKKLPEIKLDDIEAIETEIDKIDATLPPLRLFVIPGGSPAEAFCHVARSVCRRAERGAVRLAQDYEVPELVVKYLNRLSDFLFTFARKLDIDAGANDEVWNPKVKSS